jgi:signal transduction histidine kinase
MRLLRASHLDLLRYAGLFTFGCVGIPLIVELLFLSGADSATPSSVGYVGWAVSYAVFGVSYWFLAKSLGQSRPSLWRVPLLLALSISTVTLGHFSGTGLSGILLLVISGVLPWMLPVYAGVVWLLAETMALVPVFVFSDENFSWWEATLQSGVYLGFSAFTFATSLVAKEQTEAREELRRLNAELRATRALLAESTRLNERVRISRELHDLLGHHLTALSLNLEVASHLVQGQAQEQVRKAQSVARLLLSDVREAVSQLRQDDDIDIGLALATLVQGLPQPEVHLELPSHFAAGDPRRAQVMLRCAQEFITNTIRHARAANLWLRFEQDTEGNLSMSARDDGLGVEAFQAGNGLTGMRERLAQLGGSLTIETGKGRGFALHAQLPKEAPT